MDSRGKSTKITNPNKNTHKKRQSKKLITEDIPLHTPNDVEAGISMNANDIIKMHSIKRYIRVKDNRMRRLIFVMIGLSFSIDFSCVSNRYIRMLLYYASLAPLLALALSILVQLVAFSSFFRYVEHEYSFFFPLTSLTFLWLVRCVCSGMQSSHVVKWICGIRHSTIQFGWNGRKNQSHWLIRKRASEFLVGFNLISAAMHLFPFSNEFMRCEYQNVSIGYIRYSFHIYSSCYRFYPLASVWHEVLLLVHSRGSEL